MRDGPTIRVEAILLALLLVATLPALLGTIGYLASIVLILAAWVAAWIARSHLEDES